MMAATVSATANLDKAVVVTSGRLRPVPPDPTHVALQTIPCSYLEVGLRNAGTLGGGRRARTVR
jgi:hypothetical protein